MVLVPFTDGKAKKRRPALVLSGADDNGRHEDIILCAITSNLADTDHSVLVTTDDMATGALVRPSRVKADKLATIHRSRVLKIVGRLGEGPLRQVAKETRVVLGL